MINDFDYIEKCQTKLISFARAAYPGFETPYHVRKIAEKLEAVERGDIRRLIITVPPRHSKSLLSSQIFPAWCLGRNPTWKIMLTSNTQMLAGDFGRNARNIMLDPMYQNIFPDVTVSEDSKAKHTFKTNKGGEAFFLGVGGAIVGRGAHLALIDDPIKDAKEADSIVETKNLRDWYREVVYTRQMTGGRIIIIMQRWRANDLIGWLLDPNEQEVVENWEIVNFPAIAEQDEGWRNAGEALWPERYPIEELERIRTVMGTRSFNGLYQQRPSIDEGNIIQRAWLNIETIRDDELIPPRIIALDTAFKEGADNDYSAATVAQRTKHGVGILYAERRKLNFPSLLQWIEAMVRIYGIQGLLVEDKASGQSVIQTLRQHSRIPVIPIPIKKNEDKVSRLNAIAPFIESGRVTLHKWSPAYTQEELITELLQFPGSAHDDMVDSFVHAVTYLVRGGTNLKRLAGGRTNQDIPSIYGR